MIDGQPRRARLLERLLAVAAALALVAPDARGEVPTTRVTPLSPYERATLERALASKSGEVDAEPEGKIVEAVDVVPLEVIEARDPAPSILNVFHTTTREAVIRREILLAVGEPYRQYRVDESLRVLRGFQQIRDYAAARVPTSDSRAAPYLQVRAYEARFVRLHDVAQFALEEDYRVGYDAWLRAYPVSTLLGSTRDFLGFDAFAQYILRMGDGFARASGEALVELGARSVPGAALGASVALVSPTLHVGRIVVDGLVIARPRNATNQRSTLGGDGRLRGYPSAALLGENVVAGSAEFRSRPIELLASQIGAALFVDAGDAYDGRRPRWKTSVGIGLRGLFPQLDRKVWRLDVAFPLEGSAGTGPIGFYFAFEQAFPPVVATPPSSSASQAILNPLGAALGQ